MNFFLGSNSLIEQLHKLHIQDKHATIEKEKIKINYSIFALKTDEICKVKRNKERSLVLYKH